MYVETMQVYEWIANHEVLLNELIAEARKEGSDKDVTFYMGGLSAMSSLKISVEARMDSKEVR
ncbi:hypothetical protein PDM92_21150 [Bacillus cereus]|nr:hypothetical protein [Bacillus cereus]